jgi:FSR family fosmidomycin resistance protein-like MFS transporter
MMSADTTATSAREAISRGRTFAAACLAHILHDGYSSMLYLLLPSWQTELALSLTQVGILKTLYSAAMAVGQVPASRLSERWSEKLPLAAGTFITAAAVFALHWAMTPLALGLLLAIGGLGASVQHPLASALISRTYGGSALRAKLGTYNFAATLAR